MKKWISSLTLMFLLLLAPSVGAAPHTYTDVPTTHPAYNDIMLLVELGVVQKTSSYNLNKTVTREDVAVMVAKALDLDGTKTKTFFRDVPATHRASGYIQSAVDAGVIKGYNDGTFRPAEPVTRGQMAAFLVRAFELDIEAKVKFKDVTPSMAAYPYVGKLVGTKVTNGYTDGTFRPDAQLKKDQVSMFLARAIRYAYDIELPGPKPAELTVKEVVQMNDSKVVQLDLTSRWGDMQGSGILLGNNLILTNHHVADQATSGTVTFYNGKVMELEGFVYFDENNDYAILKTKGTYSTPGVKVLESADFMQKGDSVVAIGSPLGLQNSVSTGIISAFRNWYGIPAIQTDAGIDFGSSGGGLFNMYGELIGMTTGGYDSNADLNFAIASHVFAGDVRTFKSNAQYPGNFTNYINELDVPDINGLKIGMSQAEVKALNLGGELEQTQDMMYYTGASILGSTADIYLLFINDNLVWIDILHDEGYGIMDMPDAEAYFEKMYEQMATLEGEADEIDRDWIEDEYGEQAWEAYWYREDFDIMIAVAMYDDGSMSNVTVTLSGLFEE